ncbi:hypothetical protein B484DRAFT_433434, partial [Ochromonadaceae sp. CCMP2298]
MAPGAGMVRDSSASGASPGNAFLYERKSTKTADQEKKKAKARDMALSSEGGDENLGENFEESPWLPPSLVTAAEFRRNAIYHGGDARVDSLNLLNAPDLGAGTTLYFQFAMTMSICLFFMSLLSIPAMLYSSGGTGIKQEDKDTFGFYQYTLGNIGAVDYSLAASRCTEGSYAYNETCIHYGSSEITITEAANVMSAMEFLQVVIFFIGILHLQRKVYSISGQQAKTQCKISDYTVQ